MIELAIQVFGISVEVIFPVPRPFVKDQMDNDGRWLTDSASGFAVPPEQVRLRQADVLFAYDLSVQLFGGNGYFSVDAQKATFNAKKAKGKADGESLRQMVGRFLRHFAKEKLTVVFSANAHASDRCGACQGRDTDSAKRYLDCDISWADRSSSGDHR
jgi:hypothetical protein